jgi:hypothetical protein
MFQKASVGRFVHLVMRNGEVRPMLVTMAFEPHEDPNIEGGQNQHLNGHVFLDGGNDLNPLADHLNNLEGLGLDVLEGTSMARGWSRLFSDKKEPGTWHWPERV